MEISVTEENYIKAIYHIASQSENHEVTTTALSEQLNNSAASVTDMLKKLSEKKLLNYQKYKAATLTRLGEKTAKGIVRKHRLWEVFLMDKLGFRWDEVHDIAEQLEHIKSDELIQRLDEFLGKPQYDPHGDPIPNASGSLPLAKAKPLSSFERTGNFRFVGVSDHSTAFLQHLTSIGLKLGDKLKAEEYSSYDGTFRVRIGKREVFYLSHKVASNLLIEPLL